MMKAHIGFSFPDAVVLNVNQWLLHNMFPECLVNSIWNTIWNKSTLAISNMVGPEAKITISNKVNSLKFLK